LTVAVLAALVAALAAASATAAPLGEIHSFPLAPGAAAQAIVAGPEGDMWFTEPEAAAIGRITRTGSPSALKETCGSPTSAPTWRSGGSPPPAK
jgi:streptogramin lyase